MAFKDIVVHQGADARSTARLELAVALARHHGARLNGIYPLPEVRLPGSLRAAIGTDFVAEQEARLAGAAEAANAAFDRRIEAAGLTGEWRTPQGRPAECLVVAARQADLTVIG
ncbi:Universal stress protein family protein [Tistlia consotensis]|uniref:Universal stress protein family protein n=1 Tax=Tistlia consotensis USBA 355 TaxID=560819 RepID=A0A1Y6BUH6_9PROT|nr:universal stress protein [Tistlia consotensis]SMF27713.1 Universal stress protein family protein [Tistlia consotensis USBA 355]SNR65740.1 Universal stress protein family protein [Tistlia consotensis]